MYDFARGMFPLIAERMEAMSFCFEEYAMPDIPEGKVRVFHQDSPGNGWLWSGDLTMNQFWERVGTGLRLIYKVVNQSGETVFRTQET